MAKITFGTANGRKLNKHHIPITSIGTFAVNGRQVTGCIPLTRGDKIKGQYSQFSRLAPLVAPTFGSFNIKTMAFFVPAHTIWRGYRSWISGSVDSSVANDPLNFSMEDMIYLITNSASPTALADWVSEFIEPNSDQAGSYTALSDLDNYDTLDLIVYNSSTQAYHGANLTGSGRALINTLICLGYNFARLVDENGAPYAQQTYSIYPFMAYARVCYDYLYPSRYVNQQGFSFLFETALNTGWSNQVTRRSYIRKMMDTWFVQYDQDFYTSLWAEPNQVAVGSGNVSNQFQPNSNGTIGMIVQNNQSISNRPNDTYVQRNLSGESSVITTLSAQALRWLTAVSDLVLRDNIGGARFREFMKAHFGYNTDNDTCDESVFIKMWSDDVRISDVTNMSSGLNMGALGEMSGKGYSSSNGDYSISYEAKEAGFLIFVTECKPNVGYYQGNRPWARALTDRFQLYTPEFDGVGMEGVPVQAVFNSFSSSDDLTKVTPGMLHDVFGFAPRYSERYKVGHDNLFGDFRFGSRGQGNLQSWHTMRDILYGRSSALALDDEFLHMDNQYQRIFRYIGGNSSGVKYNTEDKIWSFIAFDLTKYSTAKSLGNSLPFFEEEGRDAHMNYEGSDIK